MIATRTRTEAYPNHFWVRNNSAENRLAKRNKGSYCNNERAAHWIGEFNWNMPKQWYRPNPFMGIVLAVKGSNIGSRSTINIVPVAVQPKLQTQTRIAMDDCIKLFARDGLINRRRLLYQITGDCHCNMFVSCRSFCWIWQIYCAQTIPRNCLGRNRWMDN